MTNKELAQFAYNTVLATLEANEAKHPGNEWEGVEIEEHTDHVLDHIEDYSNQRIFGIQTTEDHIANAMTRLTMIKALQK